MMKSIRETRYHNGRLLQEACGGQKVVIDVVGKSQSQISSILGDNPSKGIGNKVAREIEAALGLPDAWLDAWHDAAPEYDSRAKRFIITTPDLSAGNVFGIKEQPATYPNTSCRPLSDRDVKLLYENILSAYNEAITISDEPVSIKELARMAVWGYNESLKAGIGPSANTPEDKPISRDSLKTG